MAKERGRFWIKVMGWCLFFVSTSVAARKMQTFVQTDPQFVLSTAATAAGARAGGLTIDGVVYSTRARIVRIFSPDLGRSVFLTPIAERRRRLLGIDWVEDASVSRIWPNRIHVRITERKPVAFVNRGRVALIDAQGVFLDPPPQAQFAFPVLAGVTDRQTEAERRDRVGAMKRLMEELGPLGKDISEINAESTENMRVLAQVEGRAVELMLGDGNYARRMKNFLSHYAEIRRQTPRATVFDLRLDDRITARE